jgi:hypothetical protein
MPSGTDEDAETTRATEQPRTTRRRWLAAGAAAVTVGLAGCAFGTGSLESERSTASFSIADGTAVAVENSNGDVLVQRQDTAGGGDAAESTGTATTGDGSGADPGEVEVVIVKRTRGSRDRFANVEVEGSVQDGTLRIATFYRGALTEGQVAVDLTVRVAEGHPLERARSGNGDVEARDLPGDATLSTGNGDVVARNLDGYPKLETANGDCEATGTAGLRGARSGNGDVAVEVRAMRGDVTCSSGNGDAEVGVPPGLDADLRMEVGNGDVTVDNVAVAEEESTNSRLTGRLGDGGPLLKLSAGNGDARLYGLDG